MPWDLEIRRALTCVRAVSFAVPRMDDRKIHWLRDSNELASALDELELADANGNCLAPKIPDGAELFIDLKLQPRSGDFVLVDMPIPGTPITETVKQLLLVEEADGTQVWVVANSAGMFRLAGEKILGVVVCYIVTPGRKSQFGHLCDAAHAQTIENIARMRQQP